MYKKILSFILASFILFINVQPVQAVPIAIPVGAVKLVEMLIGVGFSYKATELVANSFDIWRGDNPYEKNGTLDVSEKQYNHVTKLYNDVVGFFDSNPLGQFKVSADWLKGFNASEWGKSMGYVKTYTPIVNGTGLVDWGTANSDIIRDFPLYSSNYSVCSFGESVTVITTTSNAYYDSKTNKVISDGFYTFSYDKSMGKYKFIGKGTHAYDIWNGECVMSTFPLNDKWYGATMPDSVPYPNFVGVAGDVEVLEDKLPWAFPSNGFSFGADVLGGYNPPQVNEDKKQGALTGLEGWLNGALDKGDIIADGTIVGDDVLNPPIDIPIDDVLSGLGAIRDVLTRGISIDVDKVGGETVTKENTFNFQPLLVLGENITEKFPFSLPWDLMRILSLFDAPPKAPNFEVEFKGQKITVLNLAEFEEVIKIFRFFILLYFITGLIKITGTLTKH